MNIKRRWALSTEALSVLTMFDKIDRFKAIGISNAEALKVENRYFSSILA